MQAHLPVGAGKTAQQWRLEIWAAPSRALRTRLVPKFLEFEQEFSDMYVSGHQRRRNQNEPADVFSGACQMNRSKGAFTKSSDHSEPNQVLILQEPAEQPETPDFDKMSVAKRVDDLFATNADSSFETGMDSVFSLSLQKIYDEHSIFLLTLLPKKLEQYAHRPELLIEMLQWLSRQRSERAQDYIRNLMISALEHDSLLVRDTAASELVWLEGIAAKAYLQNAIQRECILAQRLYVGACRVVGASLTMSFVLRKLENRSYWRTNFHWLGELDVQANAA